MTPEISVIIPTFNRRLMVREAIASVLAQREAVYELIVVDDGSTDGTWDDLVKLPPPVRAMRTTNRGPAAARNCGIAAAKGALIAFLDSDDLWMPDKLRLQYDFMRNLSNCAISQTGESWWRDGRRVNPGRRHLKRGGDIFVDSLRTCLVSPSAVILRRELVEKVGIFDEDLSACEDYDLWLRIMVRHNPGLIDEPMVTRRAGHPDQLSASIPALDRFRILALAKLLTDSTLGFARRHAAAEVMAEKCRIYAKGLLRRGHRETAAFFGELAGRALAQWAHGQHAGLEPAIARIRAMLKDKVPSVPASFAPRDDAQREVGQ
jgi:glycosyltransferase involved in cell wall biosynthesis